MERFSLDKWLQDKSRKVVTRRGNPVRIICTDRKHGEDDLPIVFLEENNGGEFLLTCRNDGRCDNYDTQYDLFFADEEEGLTNFEKVLSDIIGFWQQGNYVSKDIKADAKKLLDLAKEEILKDIPKWKKCIGSTGPFIDDFKGEDYLYLKDYVIKVSELFEKLPKEE